MAPSSVILDVPKECGKRESNRTVKGVEVAQTSPIRRYPSHIKGGSHWRSRPDAIDLHHIRRRDLIAACGAADTMTTGPLQVMKEFDLELRIKPHTAVQNGCCGSRDHGDARRRRRSGQNPFPRGQPRHTTHCRPAVKNPQVSQACGPNTARCPPKVIASGFAVISAHAH